MKAVVLLQENLRQILEIAKLNDTSRLSLSLRYVRDVNRTCRDR
jgi:hypothetical protein